MLISSKNAAQAEINLTSFRIGLMPQIQSAELAVDRKAEFFLQHNIMPNLT